ncbi:histidinol phosphate phosphatase domain-containing protein [Candidatus Magnetomonas plexicatena]|uniref:histidinol phosphate phosphatase domain-containing protein n=1 Tax=Candidatus Magnetomonas plexicatena TaxID=2552947 RepID=UPI001100C201|nr:histidinol phosphate phosphatase domain-containing protein [Nitrospirales bacterium LBB_01]
MIDLHTHSIFSDGELIPSELVARAADHGYKAIAITDHVDTSNLTSVVPNIVRVANDLNRCWSIMVIPGVEITHVPPEMIADIVKEARSLGAKVVLVHGETIVEPVRKGTNRAAIEAGVDILAHPGLIAEEDVIRAKERGVALEITARKGHSIANGYVAKMALKHSAALVINTDTHAPQDLTDRSMAERILLAAGIGESEIPGIFKNSEDIVSKLEIKKRLEY